MRTGRRRVVLAALSAVVVAACASLGVWQLQRRSDRHSLNTRLLQRRNLAALALEGRILDGRQAYRRATAEGTFDTAHEVVLRARPLNGRAGNHVLTPLRLSDGRAIVVDRGWVPLEMIDPPVAAAVPPKSVRVAGVLIPGRPKSRILGSSDPATGTLRTIGRLDLARLSRQIPYPVEPLALALESQVPPQPSLLPIPAGFPAPGEGPHLAYAVQWFIFATIALITAILLARSERRP